ncbi:hypothetical protein ABZX77_48685 [Streptomyces sp. NPDC004237]|uniref:hypothetical protein n=1 Tax=Streptomyces sp. NPDC004237 TaxID=3154455 RepID=UPI0033A301C8
MTASSPIPPGALPPELPVRRLPEPVPLSDAARAAFEAYGTVFPAPAGPADTDAPGVSRPVDDTLPTSLRFPADVPYHLRARVPEPDFPECYTCQVPAGSGDGALRPDPRGRRYPSGAQVLYCLTHLPASETVRAAAGVIEAAMANGADTPKELAQAEADAGLLFNPQRAEDIASAAAEQAHAEDKVELAERGRQLARMAGAQRRVDAVGRLLEGRPGFHLLSVAEIAAAAEYGTVPHDSSFPMTLTWTRRASVPDAHTTRNQVVVECVSSYGGRADLVVKGDDRTALGSLLDEEARGGRTPCPTDGCGTVDDYDTSDPALMGWARLEVAGLDDEPRWYCSPQCIADALARAGDELAADDQAAALDPAEQAPGGGQ